MLDAVRENLRNKPRMWQHVKGPTAAVLASMWRIGCQFHDFKTIEYETEGAHKDQQDGFETDEARADQQDGLETNEAHKDQQDGFETRDGRGAPGPAVRP